MAYWSSTGFYHYAAEDDLRNVKPRWQELAELAEVYSSPSSTLLTPTAPRANRDIGHMHRRTPGYDNGDNGLWSRRLRANDSNVASLGASRSRSRSQSRPSRPRTRMFETQAASTQRRSNTTADRKYQHTHSTRRILVSLLALIIALLSWFGIPAVRSLGLKGPFDPSHYPRHCFCIVRESGYCRRNLGYTRGYQERFICNPRVYHGGNRSTRRSPSRSCLYPRSRSNKLGERQRQPSRHHPD
jgi:hypothetical protein